MVAHGPKSEVAVLVAAINGVNGPCQTEEAND